MSMHEDRVRQAFNDLHVPEQVRQDTLGFINAHRFDGGLHSAVHAPAEAPAAIVAPARRRVARALAAACLVFAAVVAVGVKMYFEPTAYVDIDVGRRWS